MQAINSNLPQILQLNQYALQQVNSPLQNQQTAITPVSGDISQTLLNDIASLSSGAYDVGSLFDNTMNDMTAFKDLISSTQSSLAQLKGYASDIKNIIAQAQKGGLSQNVLDQMQFDVNSKILDINILKDAANSGGVNPYNSPVSVNIPSMSSFLSGGTESAEGDPNKYNLDLEFEVDGVKFAGTANVTLGTAEDGSMQLAFDVTLDYDLSSISGEGGITSENAMNVIDGLLALMGDKEGTLEGASSIMDAVFEKIFETMGSIDPNNDIINGYDSSDYLKNQIVQQSTSTLNSINFNQMPGLALSLI